MEDSKAGKTKYSALWQADGDKIVRMAPTEYMGRFMPEWWDYAIADEIHQLAGDTAQGNALGVLNKTARRFLGLTGTLLSGGPGPSVQYPFPHRCQAHDRGRSTSGVQPGGNDSPATSA